MADKPWFVGNYGKSRRMLLTRSAVGVVADWGQTKSLLRRQYSNNFSEAYLKLLIARRAAVIKAANVPSGEANRSAVLLFLVRKSSPQFKA